MTEERVCAVAPTDKETWGTEVREPVVRCRDCAHCTELEGDCFCGILYQYAPTDDGWDCQHAPFETLPDGFCFMGERRGLDGGE